MKTSKEYYRFRLIKIEYILIYLYIEVTGGMVLYKKNRCVKLEDSNE